MAVNTMSFNQMATVLNSIVSQATGRSALAVTDTASFVSVAKLGLETGYDPLMNAVSQVLSKTIFSVRPYSRKFAGLKADAAQYGNHVRKIQMLDSTFDEDDRIKLTDGASIDQQVVKKPTPLQTNFYGENVYQKSITIFRDQLDTAFSSPDEFGSFIAMVMQNVTDQIEKAHEETARGTLANFIGGKKQLSTINTAASNGETHIIYLLDEYNTATGSNVTASTYANADNFAPFMRWLSGYIKTLVGLMSERSYKYHQNFTNKFIPRHTDARDLKVYLNAGVMNASDATVMSTTFNEGYMKMVDHELVNYWQGLNSPMNVAVKAGYTSYAGAAAATTNTALSNVFGVIFDKDAVGYTTINEWSSAAPFNARGGYTNTYWHFTDRYWNDFTENGVVLLLDNAPST